MMVHSAEIKTFASFSSLIAKFAVMLDVAISLPRVLFQGITPGITPLNKNIDIISFGA